MSKPHIFRAGEIVKVTSFAIIKPVCARIVDINRAHVTLEFFEDVPNSNFMKTGHKIGIARKYVKMELVN